MINLTLFRNSIIAVFALGLITACSTEESTQNNERPDLPDVTVQTQDFKDYWYAGEAELNRYDLQRIRYGEVRDGHAMMIFVTEDFLTEPQVKLESPADGRPHETVLKLNHLEEFMTGIYEYKVMSSTFTPISVNDHPRSLKVSHSTQEWCGVVYSQLNLSDGQYQVTGHSYFENEADYEASLNPVWLEDELWTKLRLSPQLLPEGEINIIPASFAIRRSHDKWAVERAVATKEPWTGSEMPGDSLMSYSLEYQNAARSLTIVYESQSPYRIAGWVETQQTRGRDTLQATSVRTHSIKAPYWQMNSNSDEEMRQKLGFENE